MARTVTRLHPRSGSPTVQDKREEAPAEPPRCDCGAVARPLFTIGLSEWNGHNSGDWRPLQDADAEHRRAYPPAGDPTTVDLGDERMRIHYCPDSYEHPHIVQRVY